jgi:hypothetical protein
MLRTIGKWFGIFILIFFLFLTVFIHFMVKFTEFDTLNNFFTKIFVSNVISKDQLNQMYTNLLDECGNKPQYGNATLNIGNKSVILKCDDIKKSTPEGLVGLVGKSFFSDIYYKEYNCSFLDCLSKPGEDKYMVLLSQKANMFFRNIQTILWICTGIGVVLIIISVKGLGSKLKTLGATLLFSGLSTLILMYVITHLMSFPAGASSVIEELFGFFLNMLVAISITGLVLIILGYVLNFMHKKRSRKK